MLDESKTVGDYGIVNNTVFESFQERVAAIPELFEKITERSQNRRPRTSKARFHLKETERFCTYRRRSIEKRCVRFET